MNGRPARAQPAHGSFLLRAPTPRRHAALLSRFCLLLPTHVDAAAPLRSALSSSDMPNYYSWHSLRLAYGATRTPEPSKHLCCCPTPVRRAQPGPYTTQDGGPRVSTCAPQDKHDNRYARPGTPRRLTAPFGGCHAVMGSLHRAYACEHALPPWAPTAAPRRRRQTNAQPRLQPSACHYCRGARVARARGHRSPGTPHLLFVIPESCTPTVAGKGPSMVAAAAQCACWRLWLAAACTTATCHMPCPAAPLAATVAPCSSLASGRGTSSELAVAKALAYSLETGPHMHHAAPSLGLGPPTTCWEGLLICSTPALSNACTACGTGRWPRKRRHAMTGHVDRARARAQEPSAACPYICD